MNQKIISNLFILAGLSNILGALIFSKFFTNQILMNAQPEVMGYFGLLSIILWGLAYIAVSKSYAQLPWLLAVFVIEKLLYVTVWVLWLSTNSLSELYSQDVFAGIFYTIYGANDLLFGLFFSLVFVQIYRKSN